MDGKLAVQTWGGSGMAEHLLQVFDRLKLFGGLGFLMAFPTNSAMRRTKTILGENPKNIWGTAKMKFGNPVGAYPSVILWLS